MSTRFKEKLIDWQSMFDTLEPKLPDMPQFTADHAALGTILANARDLEKRQDSARSDLRDINQQRKVMIQAGADLRSRLARGLQGVLGPKSEKLIEFGVNPLPRIVHRQRLTQAQKAALEASATAAAVAAAAMASDADPAAAATPTASPPPARPSKPAAP